MNPKRLSIRIAVNSPQHVELSSFVAIFQRWIQEHAIEGLLIDVGDYKHVPYGPGVLLVGHEGDLSFNERPEGFGLSYTLKRGINGSLEERLQFVARLLLSAAQKLEQEATLSGIKFDITTYTIAFLDRLETPATEATFNVIEESLRAFAVVAFGTEPISLVPVQTDPRQPLNVQITLKTSIALSNVAQRLSEKLIPST